MSDMRLGWNSWLILSRMRQPTFLITFRNGEEGRGLLKLIFQEFLKSLQSDISKDVSLSRVFSEEQAIFRTQQLELIYSQSGVLHKYLPNAPRSKLNLSKTKPGPYGDGLIGSINSGAASLLTQLQ